MKKPKFKNHICVKRERSEHENYDIIVGEPEQPTLIDAEDGEYIAVYVLQRVYRFRTNPRLT